MPPRNNQPTPTTVPEETAVALEPVEQVAAAAPANRVLVFTSPTCGPCKQLKPVLEAINAETPFAYEVVSFDPEKADIVALFKEHGVQNVPAVLNIENGEAKNRFVGFPGKAAVIQHLTSWGHLV